MDLSTSTMTKFDRYLLTLFLKIFLICFFSFTGLYLIVHLFTNLDELISLGKAEGSQFRLFSKFYGPRILDFFDRTVAVLLLVSAVFAFAMLQRRREITAIEAAGIPKSRMIKPLIGMAILFLGVSIVNREIWIPRYREELTSTAQNWKQGTTDSQLKKDFVTGVVVRARRVDLEDARMEDIAVQLPIQLSDQIAKIEAAAAQYVLADDDHPNGLLLERVAAPTELWTINSLKQNDETIVYFPKEHGWLKGNQCFVVTNLTLDELAHGQQINEYASLSEMITSLQRPTHWYSRANRIAVHSRIVRPILDLALLLVALPLVLRFSEDNLWAAAGSCVLTIAMFQVSIMAFETMGALSIIRTASLAAWMPVFCFVPLTALTWRWIDR